MDHTTGIVVPTALRDSYGALIDEADALARERDVDLERLARWARPVEQPAVRPEYL